jgi:predicted  nucleic acid-binding Zn-ribbon protein
MDLNEQLANVTALQHLDTRIDALKKEYASLDGGQADKILQTKAEAEHNEADAALKGHNAMVVELDLEQKAVEVKRAEYETKLYSGSVTNPKELQAMQDEIDMLARQRALLDQKLLTQMDALEVCRVQHAETTKTRKLARARLREKIAAAKKSVAAMSIEARTLRTQRRDAAAAVPPELLTQYELIRQARHGLAIAAIEDSNACGACRMALPSSIVREVKLGVAIQMCPNCTRLLVPSWTA